jgi:hypothetical protein
VRPMSRRQVVTMDDAAQLERDDHTGHCHATADHPVLPLTMVCCRPRLHTGMHTTCGQRPGASHVDHFMDCRLWYTSAKVMVPW